MPHAAVQTDSAGATEARLEALIREEYERFRPHDTFADLKRRALYEKDSKGLLKHWLDIARRREAAGADAGPPPTHVDDGSRRDESPSAASSAAGADDTSTAPAAEDAQTITTDSVTVEAAPVAALLGLTPEAFMLRVRSGLISQRAERGIEEDEGLYRLTFRYRGHDAVVLVGTDGAVLGGERRVTHLHARRDGADALRA